MPTQDPTPLTYLINTESSGRWCKKTRLKLPPLAMDSVKGLSCRRFRWNSSSNSPPQIDSPPVPSPRGSPWNNRCMCDVNKNTRFFFAARKNSTGWVWQAGKQGAGGARQRRRTTEGPTHGSRGIKCGDTSGGVFNGTINIATP